MTDKRVLNVYKKVGETPLQTLKRLNIKEKLSYVGRLDPLADGVMLVLVGEENKNREKYLNLDKKYRFEFICGFRTDTYDVLGLAEKCSGEYSEITKGKRKQNYPPYSSKTVKGKPLFQYAREGKKVELPERNIEIYESQIISERKISAEDLKKTIIDKINLVEGDFRQEEIKKRWNELLTNGEYKVISGEISCSSGTYIRGLVNESGCCTTLSITRLEVGDYILGESTNRS